MGNLLFENSKYYQEVPCRIFIDYSSKSHYRSSNWHHELEILYIVSGEETIFIENECITAHPGDIVVINRERVHTLTGNNFVHHCLIPSDSIFEWLAKASKFNMFAHIQPHIQDIELSTLFLNIINEFRTERKFSTQYRTIAIQLFLLKLFENYEINYYNNINPSHTAEFKVTTKVINFLRSHLSENFSIDEIAKELKITTPHMCRCVKSCTGLTIIENLDILRCYTGKHLLTHSDKKIGEIAQLCGYSNSSYFAKKYKKIMGILPGETKKD